MKNLIKIKCRNCAYSFYQNNKNSGMCLTHKEGYEDKEVVFSDYTNEYANCPVCGGILATD